MTGVHLIITMTMNTALFINDLAVKHSDSYVGLPEGFAGIHIISYCVYRDVVLFNYNITYVYTWYVYIMVELYSIFKMTYMLWYKILRLFPIYIYIERERLQYNQLSTMWSFPMYIWDLVLGVLMFKMCGTDFTEGKGQRSANGKSTSKMGRF